MDVPVYHRVFSLQVDERKENGFYGALPEKRVEGIFLPGKKFSLDLSAASTGCLWFAVDDGSWGHYLILKRKGEVVYGDKNGNAF